MKLSSSNPSYHQSLFSSSIYFRPHLPIIPGSFNTLSYSNHDITTLVLLVATPQPRQSCLYYISFFTLIITFPSAHLHFSITHTNILQTITLSRPYISSKPPPFLYFNTLYPLLHKNLLLVMLFSPKCILSRLYPSP